MHKRHGLVTFKKQFNLKEKKKKKKRTNCLSLLYFLVNLETRLWALFLPKSKDEEEHI